MTVPSESQAVGPAPDAAPLRKSALDVEDDYSKYEVQSRTEVLSILRGLMEQGSMITLYFNHGYDFLLTSLLEIADDGRTLLLDYGSNMDMNRKLLQTDKINCVSSMEKVKIQFTLMGVDPIRYQGRDAFEGDTPATLIRLQRREFYRLSTPMANPLKANIPLQQKDGSVKIVQAAVVDLSGGGLGLNVPPEETGLQRDAEFAGVSISLPNIGVLKVDLRVRNLYDVTMPNGKVHQRAGCQFLKLPGPMMTLVQRYINAIERERKAREI